jgi:hypothetical protein
VPGGEGTFVVLLTCLPPSAGPSRTASLTKPGHEALNVGLCLSIEQGSQEQPSLAIDEAKTSGASSGT